MLSLHAAAGGHYRGRELDSVRKCPTFLLVPLLSGLLPLHASYFGYPSKAAVGDRCF